MRKARNVAFMVLVAVFLVGTHKASAFGCVGVSYFNYGYYGYTCGPYAGQYSGCGWQANDCQANCFYGSNGQWWGDLQICSSYLVDEESDLWTVDVICTCRG